MTSLRNLVSAVGGVAITAVAILFFIVATSSLVLTGMVPLVMLVVGLNGG
ncbi:MAG: hypothetical protein HQL72_02610 [Magnetococcales bacterium]|nr:hypothetical protein [Magnetococcales bacterium]